MKRNFTFLIAAFALLLFMTPAMVGWGQTRDTKTDIMFAKGFGSYTTNSFSAAGTDRSSVANSTNATGVTYAMQVFNGSTGAVRGNQSGASNYSCRNTTTYDGYYISSVSLTVSGGTLDGSTNNRSVVYFGSSAYSNPNNTAPSGTATSPSPASSGQSTLTWTNTDENVSHFILYNLKTSGTALSANAQTPLTVVWTQKSGTPTPSMSVSPNSIDFGSNEINPTTPYTETFEVTFANLTENLTVTGFTGVSVSPATINYNATSPQAVTVSYNPTAAGSISGNISVNSSEVTEALVAVTGSAYDPANVDTYEKYTGAIVEGDYVIYANNYALKNTLNNGPRFDNESVTVTNNTITNPSASIIWHIAPIENTEYWTIYNADVQKYAGGTQTKNQGALLDEITDFAKWSIYYQTSILYIKNYGRSQGSDPNNCYIRQNGTNGWATYASGTGAAPQLYKKVIANQVAKPSFSVAEGTYFETQSITLSCATDGATIYYTIDGTTPSASNGTEYTTNISVSTTTTIKAIAVKSGMADSDVATATYTIEQPYSTIPALFAAATAVEQDVRVTFGNWVVSSVSTNGRNVYVTDNSGNGFIIYFTSDMSGTFSAGKILSGTSVACKLKLYYGAAELVNLNASDLTITDGGTVSTVNIAMASLSGVNTGALVHYDNLTCTLNNNKYNLSDGTTTLQAYNTLYDFNEFENGKTYNVTGVYVQYNSTKQIAPRSTNDIVEVTVQYTLTIGNPQNVTITATYDGGGVEDEVLNNGDDAQVLNGTVITLAITPASGYVLSNYSVLDGSGQPVTLTSVPNTTDMWTFVMPASNVTVSATVVDASTVTTYSLATTIESGKQYIIVGWADSKPYAMGYQKSNNRHAVEISVDGNTATATIADTETNAHEFTITSLGSGFYSIEDATNSGGYLYAASSSANQLKTESTLSDNSRWKITVNSETGLASVTATNSSNRNVMQFNNSDKLFACYASASQHPVYLYQKVEPTEYNLDITGYGTNPNVKSGWYLISSPIGTVNPANVTNMLGNEYDLYRFNQSAALEWENYKGDESLNFLGGFSLEAGHGYLYANSGTSDNNNVTLTFTGTPYNQTGSFDLVYSTANTDENMHGWNLMGNPFPSNAKVSKSFYKMNSTSDGINADPYDANSVIASMEGVFVLANQGGETVTFTATNDPVTVQPSRSINLYVNRNGEMLDRAVVSFNTGGSLCKLVLSDNTTKLYFRQGQKDYAIIASPSENEVPVNFKASRNGRYTITVNPEDVEMNYLHLIDNMTGANVDLLATPSYSFEATTTDYASRFRLVFSATSSEAENDTESFAYFNGTEWMVSNEGEANLQVIDLTGRILSNETINGMVAKTITATPGIYMLRLVNNNEVKTQKILVK